MLLLVTLVSLPAPATWHACLWLCVVLLPLASVVVYTRQHQPRPAQARRPRPEHSTQRQCLRWPTCFPVVLLLPDDPVAPLPPSRRLRGTVLDISAGGLRVRVPELLPPHTRLQIDPQFRGPYPLAGLHCEVVTSRQEGEQLYVQLCFLRLPARIEASIVRRIYRHQLGRRPIPWEEDLRRPGHRTERRF